jgi:hypothetical protein
MSSNALEAQGTSVEWLDSQASPNEFRVIPEIKQISGPSGSASVIDVSDVGSGAREKRMGLPDEGQLQLTLNYIADNEIHSGMRAARVARTLEQFRITWTDDTATQFTFDGYISGFAPSAAVDGTVEAQVTIEISGAITEA